MATLFKSYYEKQYKAPLCSCSALSVLIIYIFALLGPFFFVYYTNSKFPKTTNFFRPLGKITNILGAARRSVQERNPPPGSRRRWCFKPVLHRELN